MTVKECYSRIEGNYEAVRERLQTDEKIKKFLYMLLRDDHYAMLCKAMEEGNYEDAFLNVHTLKGMGTNLGLSKLYEEARVLTELLRDGECSSEAEEAYERVKETYTLMEEAIEELRNSDEGKGV